MDSLPRDLKRYIGQYLDSKDVLSMAQMNKRTKTDLAVSALLPPLEFIANGHWVNVTDTPICGPEIPLDYGPKMTHSVTLTCNWRDQGWGNRKSQLFVVGRNTSNDALPIRPHSEWTIDNGHVLYSSPIAEHHAQTLALKFWPRDDCNVYHLWFKVGGGGGHELFVNDVKVHCVVYEDNRGNGVNRGSRAKAYKALEELGVLSGTVRSSYNTSTDPAGGTYQSLIQALDPSNEDSVLVSYLASLGQSADETPLGEVRAVSSDASGLSALRELGKFLTEYPLRTTYRQDNLLLDRDVPRRFAENFWRTARPALTRRYGVYDWTLGNMLNETMPNLNR